MEQGTKVCWAITIALVMIPPLWILIVPFFVIGLWIQCKAEHKEDK